MLMLQGRRKERKKEERKKQRNKERRSKKDGKKEWRLKGVDQNTEAAHGVSCLWLETFSTRLIQACS